MSGVIWYKNTTEMQEKNQFDLILLRKFEENKRMEADLDAIPSKKPCTERYSSRSGKQCGFPQSGFVAQG
jgi:hypothetical protein